MAITSVRLPDELLDELSELASKINRSKSWLIGEAVKEFIARANEDTRRWQETLEALDAVKAGEVVDGEAVDEWPAQWGSGNKLPTPR